MAAGVDKGHRVFPKLDTSRSLMLNLELGLWLRTEGFALGLQAYDVGPCEAWCLGLGFLFYNRLGMWHLRHLERIYKNCVPLLS